MRPGFSSYFALLLLQDMHLFPALRSTPYLYRGYTVLHSDCIITPLGIVPRPEIYTAQWQNLTLEQNLMQSATIKPPIQANQPHSNTKYKCSIIF